MKLLMLEITAEEMKANRTVMDTVVDTLIRFSDNFALSPIPHNMETSDDEGDEVDE